MTGARRRSAPAASAWPGKWSIIAGVAALVGAAWVWWHATGDPLEAAGARTFVSAAPPARAAPARTAPGRVAPLPPPAVAPYPTGGVHGVVTDDPLTAYRKANVYPPTSRPLSKDQLDLLQPNRRHETVREADRGDGITYMMTADRYYVIADEAITATLEVRRDGKPIAVSVARAFAVVLDPAGTQGGPREVPLAFAPAAGILAARLAPATLKLARQAAISINVEFNDGDGTQRAHIDFQYTPAAGIPARFTGAFHDAIEAGSLVIHTGVDVASPGPYLIDANLFDANDQPVAWTRFKGDLAAGTQDAALVFFGKVIVDAGARGPFHIGQLRGARYALGRDPDLEQMPPFTGAFTTGPYRTDEFSSAEYDSPDKQRMIDLLSNDRTHRGGAGGGGPAGDR